jgi:hypothetical protein
MSNRFVQTTQIAAWLLQTQPSSKAAKLLCTDHDHRRQVQIVGAPTQKPGLEAQR